MLKRIFVFVLIIVLTMGVVGPSYASALNYGEDENPEKTFITNQKDGLPFIFEGRLDKNGNLEANVTVQDYSVYSNVEIVVNEKGHKNNLLSKKFNKSSLVIKNMMFETEYNFTIKFHINDNVETFFGDIIVHDGEENYALLINDLRTIESSNNFNHDTMYSSSGYYFDELNPNDFAFSTTSTVTTSSISQEVEGANTNISLSVGGAQAQYYGKINYAGDVDTFVITSWHTGDLNIWLDVPSSVDYDIKLYDQYYNLLSSSVKGTGQSEHIKKNINANQKYYVEVYGYGGSFSSSLQYLFKASVYGYPDAYETNDTMNTAKSLSVGHYNQIGNIHSPTDVDYYRIYVSGNSELFMTLSNIPTGKDYDVYIYNGAGGYVAHSAKGSNSNENISVRVPIGNYFIKVYGYNGSYSGSKYTLNIGYSRVWDAPNGGMWTPTTRYHDYYGNTIEAKQVVYLDPVHSQSLYLLRTSSSARDDLRSYGTDILTTTMVAAWAHKYKIPGLPAWFAGVTAATLIFYHRVSEKVEMDLAMSNGNGYVKLEIMNVYNWQNGEWFILETWYPWYPNSSGKYEAIDYKGYHGTFTTTIDFNKMYQ